MALVLSKINQESEDDLGRFQAIIDFNDIDKRKLKICFLRK